MLTPTVAGVEASWLLRSGRSPEVNALRFGLPEGAKLAMVARGTSGAAEVSLDGKRLLWIAPVVGIQADGMPIKVSYSVSGDTLSTHVGLEGSVDFPVLVDPVVEQEYGGGTGFWPGNQWSKAGTEDVYFQGGPHNAGVLAGINPGVPANEWAAWSVYPPRNPRRVRD